MPEQMRDIKRRIRSIKNTEQITKAMEMVAAARLRRAQEKVEAARPYAREIQGMIERIAGTFAESAHPLLVPRERKSVGYAVFTSDRGLCGAFNAHIIRQAEAALAQEEEAGLVVIGRKGRDYFRRRKYNLVAEFLAIGDEPTMAQAQAISRALVNLYEGNTFDEINLVFTEFISTGRQHPKVVKLLPIDVPGAPAAAAEGDGEADYLSDYFIEPSPRAVLEMLLPRFIDAEVYRALLESKASEHAARMVAMSHATENAGEMIQQLTLLSNKARQAAITKEISEIVGGAEALKG